MAVLPLRLYGDPDSNNSNNNNNLLPATTTTQQTSTGRPIPSSSSSSDCRKKADIPHFLALHRLLLSIPAVVVVATTLARRPLSSFIRQLCPSGCKTFSTIRRSD
jgi:hypothetical protein